MNRPSPRLAARLADQLAGDDDALDVAGAFVDLQPLNIAVVALDREHIRVAAPAEQRLWQPTFCMSPNDPDSVKVSRSFSSRLTDTLCYAA